MLMDPPVMQADCQLENGVEKIPSISYDRKHTLSHGNYAWQGPDVHLTNDANNPVEVNNSSRTGTNEKLDGSSEKSSVSLHGLPQVNFVAPCKEKNDEDAYFSNVRFQLNVSTENNGSPGKDINGNKHCVGKEDLHHSQEDMHAPANRVTGLGSCQSNGDALSSVGQKMIEEQIKQNANVDAESKEVGTDMMSKQVGTEMLSKDVRTDMVGSHAIHKELHCTDQELSEIANGIGLVHKKFQEENETSVSPKNCTDLLVHNNSCNGNTNDAGGEMDTENIEDHAVALWVKWRGKWQTGIRCCRVDCPLSTLKAKPTIDRKSYVVVFFPRTRSYSWVDMLLILPIDEYPVPLVNGTHRKWRTLVKDLSVPRRFIMQKLAISMLNFGNELHTEAIIENARKVAAWKEFAQEASCCGDYTDLGKMLVKLQNMILPDYTSSHWLQNSSNLWVQKCNIAHDAETVELLAEELRQSVLWDKVDELWNAAIQPELVPEWKTWKQEAMKQFFSSHAIGNTGNFEQSNCYDDPGMDQQTRRKRPKLEVRRGETHFSHMDDANCSTLSEDPNHNNLLTRPIADGNIEASASTDQNNNATFLSNSDHCEIAESGTINPALALQNGRHEFDSLKNSRQCSAYMETKGRQCGRWANDGDIYCCVHQSMHFAEHSSREDKALTSDFVVCSGMTNLGRQCKHRAQYGSVFCKKHRSQTNLDTISSDNLFSSAEGFHKREESPNKGMEKNCNSNALCVVGSERASGSQVSVQVKLISTMSEEISGDKARGLESTGLLYPMSTFMATANLDTHVCIGILSHDNIVECQDDAKRHTLYCEKHLPKFLKRARDGKSRLISKDVFINLLKCCASKKEKICLHRACEFLYWFLRNNISRQHSGLDSDYMPQLLAEVSKDPGVGEFLLKLISSEREKLANLWGFGVNESKQLLPDNLEGHMMVLQEERTNPSADLKCKICFQDFYNDQCLGLHWTQVHRKETRWLFRGYSCAVCMDPFTNRKVLEKHVQESHGAQFIQYSILFRCMSCNSNFLNMDLLWQHIVSDHTHEFRLLDAPQRPKGQSVKRTEGTSIKALYDNDNLGKDDGSQKLTCRLCGLKFDILPDLRRHHQVAHMDQGAVGHMPSGFGKYQLNRGRHYYSAFRKSLRPSTSLKKSSGFGFDKRFKISSSDLSMITSQIVESETANLGKLLDFQCSNLAQTLFSKIQKTRPHPSNLDILSVARSVCCKTSLLAALEVKYGSMPENIFVKAAKLCSDIGIQINWHQEEFICPKGCKSGYCSNTMPSLQPTQVDIPVVPSATNSLDNGTWGMEEYHYVLDSEDFGWKLKNERVVLCEDVSFGGEKFPIVCAINVDAKESVRMKPEELVHHCSSVPWQGFHYVTARLMDSSLVDSENCVVSCACSHAHCSPGKCDHVNLFDGVHENPVDIYGLPMHGRFAYDENSKIILQEGYPIYECNSLCTCDASCPNKVLQQGLVVKLEIFRTENKGWAIRAAEPIPRGTFVCEYVGEVVKDDDAMRNVESEAKHGCSYLFDIASHIDRERVKTLGSSLYMIDATRYGNVSRFINHSCSPNLNTRLVLVESKDCQLAHIGLFANQDIAPGEELSYDYRQKLLPGDGCPCHCGAQNCRGRVY